MFSPVARGGDPLWSLVSSWPDHNGHYGTRGVADPANRPGARGGANGWSDGAGRLWLFGGIGFDERGMNHTFNDLWRFDPATGLWTWLQGSPDYFEPGSSS